jgi:hypothetical protein
MGRQVQGVRQVLLELQKLYQDTYRTTGALRGEGLYQARAALLGRLDGSLRGWLRHRVIDSNQVHMRRALNLSTQRTLHAWRLAGSADAGIPRLDRRIQLLNTVGRTASRVGYVGIALDVAWSAREISLHMEANRPDRNREIAGEVGGLAGGVFGGAGGVALANGACNLIFGGLSGGTSLLWCGVAVGAVGALGVGIAGNSLGRQGGYWMYNTFTPNSVLR